MEGKRKYQEQKDSVDMRRLWREGRSLERGPGKRRLLGGQGGFGRGECRRGVGRGLVVSFLLLNRRTLCCALVRFSCEKEEG